MKKILQAFMLSFFVFAVYACIPVPVPVSTTTTYETSGGYGYYDDYYEYADVPIVYGQPMYYSPPIYVSFYYDYFTYEPVGPYVDIVFWSGGKRFRHHTWHEKGRRITAADIRSTRPHYRIPGSEFRKHRESLKRHHNITHPDSYYGLKKSPKPVQTTPPQTDRRPQMERTPSQPAQQKPVWGTQTPQQTDQRPQWNKREPTRVERPQVQPSVPQRVERPTGQFERRTQPGQQPPRQVEQKTPGVKPPPRTEEVRETPQQTKKRLQQEQQKRSKDRSGQTGDGLKKTEEEAEQDREDMKGAWPQPRRR